MAYNKKNKLENYKRIAEWQQKKIDDYFPDRNANMAYLFDMYKKDTSMTYVISYKTFINIYNYPAIYREIEQTNITKTEKKIVWKEQYLFPELEN